MEINKIAGIILILGSLALGYLGINKISENTTSVKVFDLKIDMSNESKKEQGYIYLGLAVVLFSGGIYTFKKHS
ncbi:MAG: hypothetical protein R3342_06090 [Lutibacter sp.]|uniref:hypothetical protein n=1 Tax=Lutibacter sp. TaxID=1925666 RepID=UPI00299E00CF|nr:hypothetical protein [Lutibacter sp.]MDX1829101.1 hypothetical protein [Lutibacter sp.]